MATETQDNIMKKLNRELFKLALHTVLKGMDDVELLSQCEFTKSVTVVQGDFIHWITNSYYPDTDFGSDALAVIQKAILNENGAFRVFEMCREYFNNLTPGVVLVLYGDIDNPTIDYIVHTQETRYGDLYEREYGFDVNDPVSSGVKLFDIIFNVYSGSKPGRVIWISNECSYALHMGDIHAIFNPIMLKLKSEFFNGI